MAKYYDYPLEFVRFEQDERMAAGCGTYYTEYSMGRKCAIPLFFPLRHWAGLLLGN